MQAASTFGPYRLIRPAGTTLLGFGRAARRFIAIHERRSTSHVLYVLADADDRLTRKRFFAAVERIAPIRDAHLLKVDAFSLCPLRGCCLVSAYPGGQGGLITLGDLAEQKGGMMNPLEAHRVAAHMLGGLITLHAAGLADGAFAAPRTMVDPHGRIVLELPGLAWLLSGTPGERDELVRQDVRAAAAVIWRVLTGQIYDPAAMITAPTGWRRWFALAMDPLGGFPSAAAALAALPTREELDPDRDSGGRMILRRMLGRLRSAVIVNQAG